MEIIRSRQNELIRRVVALGKDAKARREAGEYVCAGTKLLNEAAASGAEITCVLSAEPMEGYPVRLVTPELLASSSPFKDGTGPVFTVRACAVPPQGPLSHALVLENVQDPGNVGTALRTADAFGVGLVALCGACADPYNPKAVRASMGAIFRQPVVSTETAGLPALLGDMPLYGAALAAGARDIRTLGGGRFAVAVGNEGRGLTEELMRLCAGTVVIPMRPCAESLNAGVAAAIAMWEMVR